MRRVSSRSSRILSAMPFCSDGLNVFWNGWTRDVSFKSPLPRSPVVGEMLPDGSPGGCWRMMQCTCSRPMLMTTNSASQFCRKLATLFRSVLAQILPVPLFKTIRKPSSAAGHFPFLEGPSCGNNSIGTLESGFSAWSSASKPRILLDLQIEIRETQSLSIHIVSGANK